MEIRFNPYQKRDGSLMLYINRSNNVSVGISEEYDFTPYGKWSTQGKRNCYDAALNVIARHGKEFTGDITKHAEGGFCQPVVLANGWLMAGTDVAEIGGMKVGSDGHYLIACGKIISMGVWHSE